FFQKSHDFELNDDKRLFCRYLIQTRSLVPSLQSLFELALRKYGLVDTREVSNNSAGRERTISSVSMVAGSQTDRATGWSCITSRSWSGLARPWEGKWSSSAVRAATKPDSHMPLV